jgi:hypothetical protein
MFFISSRNEYAKALETYYQGEHKHLDLHFAKNQEAATFVSGHQDPLFWLSPYWPFNNFQGVIIFKADTRQPGKCALAVVFLGRWVRLNLAGYDGQLVGTIAGQL